MQPFESSMDEGGFFNSIAVTGLGLIGGSMVKALRLNGYTGSVIGIDPDSETRKLAEASGLFEKVLENASESSSQVDLLILAVPLE
jgi:prephenate dehydrogenase